MGSLKVLNYGYIRETEDGRYSVYDTIEVLADKKNPRETFKRLCDEYTEVVKKCDNLQFPGAGQRLTPVATKENILYIIGLLPGAFNNSKFKIQSSFIVADKLKR